MRKRSFLLLPLLLLLMTVSGQTFPEKENNCFQNFNPTATGRNDVNAYLLSYLSRIVYYQYLNKDNGYNLRPADTSRFRDKFIERTRHFFQAPLSSSNTTTLQPKLQTVTTVSPTTTTNLQNVQLNTGVQYEWVWRSDGVGKNPEAMLISTPQTIYVVFRGTDRVDGGRDGFGGGDFEWGEWIYTDFKISGQKPCNTCNVKVHAGFLEALNFAGFRTHLVNSIKRMGGETKHVWITGHSLGGGMAQLFGYLLKKIDNIEARGIYVYNSPHPGDAAFATEMNSIFRNQRLQRFEFLDDPITSGPPQFINWVPGGVQWGRAGTRNWFSKESSGGYNFAMREKQGHEDLSMLSAIGGPLFGGLCFHHATWIPRALYNLLPATMQAKVPNPPARISTADEGCNGVDINNGVSGRLHDPGTDIVPAGTYRLKNVLSNRFLSATTNCGINGCCDLLQVTSTTGTAVQWRIAKVPNAIFESYTLTSVLNSKVVDADAPFTGSDGCKVHLCERQPIAVPLRTNQEWRFEKLPNGNFRIRCVAGERYLRVAPGCASQDGCRFELHTNTSNASEWQLIKIN
ncbi:MAG TPA: hypothetical protein PKE07_07715 [Lacibacter sp.]|mgnify:CR=1 FL=1|nr:hypothetical protein [Lacibacter sp.]HMO88461.1 hypothetical protein [Lacibacter sp.]